MGLGSSQGDEKQLLFSNYCPWTHRPTLCHLDRSEAQWRDLRFSGLYLEMSEGFVVGIERKLKSTLDPGSCKLP
jgi:hypothetical protein